MTDVRRNAERLHDEAKIMHLDPDHREASRMLEISARVMERVRSMIADRPALAVMSPEELRLLHSPTSFVSLESALQRAELGVLEVRAVERRDQANPFTGDAA